MTIVGTKFPDAPPAGQFFLDISTGTTWVYTGTTWKPVGSTDVTWYLFLDDLREPTDVGWFSGDIVVARSSDEAKRLVEEKGLPCWLSLDHDLGGEDTAFKFLMWLVYGHIDKKWDLGTIEKIQVHSANPIGVDKLIGLWEGFCKHQSIAIPIDRVWPGKAK